MSRGGIQWWLAKVAWVVPATLLLLALNQADVAADLLHTLRKGVAAVATVTDYERVDRADVTYGYVNLAVAMPDGSTLAREKMSLPYSLIQKLDGVDTVDVRVLLNADQEVVITMVARTQWKIAAIQAGIAFLAALIALVGVYAWNRLLSSKDEEVSGSGGAPRTGQLADKSVVGA